MTINKISTALAGITLLLLTACSASKKFVAGPYKPDDLALYNTIVQQDSIYFDAYNKCNMVKQTAMYDADIEFYHDKGGLMTSKKDLLESIKKNICGKVTRELVPGSIEVYPIKDYGAIEMGLHKFHNNQEKENTPSHAGKFIIIWELTDKDWKIKRVVSLH